MNSSTRSHSVNKLVRKIGSGSNRSGFRSLFDEEYKEKRAKGLCFTCDEKFTLEHMCMNKHYHYMVIEEKEEAWEKDMVVAIEQQQGTPGGNLM